MRCVCYCLPEEQVLVKEQARLNDEDWQEGNARRAGSSNGAAAASRSGRQGGCRSRQRCCCPRSVMTNWLRRERPSSLGIVGGSWCELECEGTLHCNQQYCSYYCLRNEYWSETWSKMGSPRPRDSSWSSQCKSQRGGTLHCRQQMD